MAGGGDLPELSFDYLCEEVASPHSVLSSSLLKLEGKAETSRDAEKVDREERDRSTEPFYSWEKEET